MTLDIQIIEKLIKIDISIWGWNYQATPRDGDESQISQSRLSFGWVKSNPRVKKTKKTRLSPRVAFTNHNARSKKAEHPWRQSRAATPRQYACKLDLTDDMEKNSERQGPPTPRTLLWWCIHDKDSGDAKPCRNAQKISPWPTNR